MVASELFTIEDHKAITDAVAAAEQRTAGEIVPIVATASDRYERAEDLYGLITGCAAVAAAWLAFMGVRPATGEWTTGPELTIGLLHVLALFVVGAFVGMKLAARIPFLKRALVPRGILRSRVARAAEVAFENHGVRGTKSATGIVLYVSLFEHVVAVHADRAISDKVDPAEWKTICDDLTASLRAGRPRDGFIEAIRKAGDLLATHFPVRPGDVNELTNDLRFLD